MLNFSHRSHRFKTALLLVLLALPVWAPSFRRVEASPEGILAGQPKSVYRERRQKLLQQVRDGIVVMIGAREEDFGEVGRFRQRNDFMYLTGVETPAAYLILVPGGVLPGRPESETVFIPPRNLTRERWTGIKLGPGAEAQQIFGIADVAPADKFKERLDALLSGAAGSENPPPKIYTVVTSGPGSELSREARFVEMLKQSYPKNEISNLAGITAEMRKVKEPSELDLLQKAVDVSLEGHREIAKAIKPGVYEYEAQAALEAAFTRLGSERTGYPSIIGSGFNSTILHYNENRKKIAPGELVVVDAAAEYSYYTADITRTFPASGRFTPRQRDIYRLVLEAQRAAEKAFKPGESTMKDLQQAALQVMKSSPLRDKQGNTLERYFIHGLGHWIGMDVHDVGSYGVLPAGSVITIESGIYIQEEKLGVRIEDDYLVTNSGLKKLSAKLPCEPEEVERMMSRGAPSARKRTK